MDSFEILHAHKISLGCRIEYLPLYSPDLNPIEQAWSAIKCHLRQQGISFFSACSAYYELYQACEVVTPEMTFGFFSHSSYRV
ncbi:hypothetical protein BDN67DRAFT_908219 [Paxillus ammoniavirescens]|nr:hypothetical protein BDN67DRAFT_908219 [Paxillus ammoniavirescens]